LFSLITCTGFRHCGSKTPRRKIWNVV
jgi:hypothetical protein